MKRVTLRYSAGASLVVAALIYLASCQSGSDVKPTSHIRTDSTNIRVMNADDPPKKPGGPGCCQ